MTDVAKALRRAFQLGQTYWQQADSDSYKQNKLSDATGHEFEDLVLETVAALTRQSEEEAPSVLAQCAVPYEGYVTAFYELAAIMGIGAQPATPEQVWREQMLPRLRKALS